MKKKKKIPVGGLAVILVLILCGCGSTKPANRIVGKWKDTGTGWLEGSTLQFFKDGTLLGVGIYLDQGASAGDYEFVDDTHIKLDFGWVVGSHVCEFSLSENKLILTYPDRGVRAYRRLE